MPLSIRACRPISPRSYRAGLPPVSYEWMSVVVALDLQELYQTLAITAHHCKRYHMSEPLADPKVSHWPRQSAILERQFERAEGKKGVSRGTSRRNSYLGLDPGQKPACSSRPFWALT